MTVAGFKSVCERLCRPCWDLVGSRCSTQDFRAFDYAQDRLWANVVPPAGLALQTLFHPIRPANVAQLEIHRASNRTLARGKLIS